MKLIPEIQAAVAAIHAAADQPPPSAARCVTPLRELIEGDNLTCHEIGGLSSRTAMNFLLQRGGLIEPLADANDEPLAGFLYASRRAGIIFVERGDLLVRRRFSAAHELGHFLLHFRPLLASLQNDGELFLTEALNASAEEDEPDAIPESRIAASEAGDLTARLPPLEQMEREASLFAVELLMPAPVVREMAAQRADDFRGEDLVWRMATEMLVSRAAMRFRLRELGWLAPETALVN